MSRLLFSLAGVLSLIAVAAGALLTIAPAAASAKVDQLTIARDATAAFNVQSSAQAAGYSLFTDVDGIACIDQPGMGAMGIHYVNGALVQSGTIDPARPQAVLYELDGGDHLRLVAVEYVVVKSVWDAAHSAAPSLFGQQFMSTPEGNRFGLPAFYSLHAWIWKRNPSGMFNMWNPRVNCSAFSRPESGSLLGDVFFSETGSPH